ncbi:MAG: hypothetical protein M1832_006422 [Thelocarpon impressellum]|nr:MAG: hypothetical protein M1832_006422 [Thelocarpon impressellum]
MPAPSSHGGVSPPFDPAAELNGQLEITYTSPGGAASPSLARRLVTGDDGGAFTPDYLPDEARMQMLEPQLADQVQAELLTPELDALARHLWLVATQSSAHITPLHGQLVRGRSLVVAESPRLHLLWAYDRVYVKPMPEYLLSHAFWSHYLGDERASPLGAQRAAVRAAACGFVRSYAYLIRHRSDFELAQRDSHRLIPRGISYSEFCRFIRPFEALDDADVSLRYGYGELRLTRLNFWTKIFLRRFTYHKLHGQYASYLARFYGPLLFVFALFSVALSAMQVEVSVQALPEPGSGPWQPFTWASRGFAVFTLISVALAIAFLVTLSAALVIREACFAVPELLRKRWSGEGSRRITKV